MIMLIDRSDLVLIKRKIRTYLVDFPFSVSHGVTIKERLNLDKDRDVALPPQPPPKNVEYEVDGDTNCS